MSRTNAVDVTYPQALVLAGKVSREAAARSAQKAGRAAPNAEDREAGHDAYHATLAALGLKVPAENFDGGVAF